MTKRIENTKFAVQAGSNILVIGRPITKSKNPLNSIEKLLKILIMENNLSIKICGINNKETAKVCNDVDYVGFVFYQKSTRFVTAFQAKEISKFLPKTAKKVGLFVNANLDLIEHIAEFVNLDFIQLHGNENLSTIKALKQRLNKPIIKAIPIDSLKDVEMSKKFEPFCEMILFDTKNK